MTIQTRERSLEIWPRPLEPTALARAEEVSGQQVVAPECSQPDEVSQFDLAHATLQESRNGLRRIGKGVLQVTLRVCNWLLNPPPTRPRERTDIIFRR